MKLFSFAFRHAASSLVAAVTVTCGLSTAPAATLSSVPMQGGMVMPMVAYHAEHGHLHLMMPADIPQLTPLLVSHPGDGFDPQDPWFDALDPSRQGLAFSRRYGFVMDAMTDPLPPNTGIWLRKLSGAAALGFYRYASTEPKAWEPIFGTGSSSNALAWNGMMFHPGVVAPPGTNALTATFEAYLVDTATGQEIPGSGSGPAEFLWTNIADGRPVLEVGTRLVIAWPEAAAGYQLEWADSLTASTWTAVSNTPVVVDGQPAVVLKAEEAAKYFRMRRSP